MTLVSSPGLWYPDPQQLSSFGGQSAGFDNSVLIDAAAEKDAFTFEVPKAGQIARIGFRTNTVNTGDTIKVSLQDVDPSTGDPDGVADQFRTIVIASSDDNTWKRTGLITSDGTDTGTLRTVARGDLISVVREFSSFVAGSINFAVHVNLGARAPIGGRSYVSAFTTGAWVKAIQYAAAMAIEYSDGTFAYVFNALPFASANVRTFNNGSTPDEVALRFKLGFPARCAGFWIHSTLSGGPDVVLYDSNDTVLASVTLNANAQAYGSGSPCSGIFTTPVNLSGSQFYRLALKPTAVSLILTSVSVDATAGAAQFDQVVGGQNFHQSTRTNGGAWTDDPLSRMLGGLLLDMVDDGASTGGGMRLAGDGGLAA